MVAIFGMVESWQNTDDQWFEESTVMISTSIGIRSWDELVGVVKGFLWFNHVFDSKIDKFRGTVASKLSAVG